jgi:hypothetical protein
MSIEITIKTPDDLKSIIREYNLSLDEIQSMTMFSLGYFASYESIDDICNEIDEMVTKYPDRNKRPIFGRYSLDD